ncbi:uncharacterized protein EI90DRAFT_3035397 [Cantharellus anzutake]|uniref:uncharacterized protein n=1 Tax=Cantharellus anzutake TaxID=1750568 RepID=UPI00190406FD|nr:uncharacterized protein EI90DRAFT_3035397 [Cantharellus anzutake]KAF8340386.1 hypothetical protein EI90DRAFT_3035397 [Cantharellus anzutake]
MLCKIRTFPIVQALSGSHAPFLSFRDSYFVVSPKRWRRASTLLEGSPLRNTREHECYPETNLAKCLLFRSLVRWAQSVGQVISSQIRVNYEMTGGCDEPVFANAKNQRMGISPQPKLFHGRGIYTHGELVKLGPRQYRRVQENVRRAVMDGTKQGEAQPSLSVKVERH